MTDTLIPWFTINICPGKIIIEGAVDDNSKFPRFRKAKLQERKSLNQSKSVSSTDLSLDTGLLSDQNNRGKAVKFSYTKCILESVILGKLHKKIIRKLISFCFIFIIHILFCKQ